MTVHTMSFELDDDLVDVAKLATSIFTDMADPDRVKHIENHGGGYDAKLWSTLAAAGLLGIALPEALGGAGLGMLGLISVLQAQGAAVAPVPIWSAIAGAALPIAHFGTAEQQNQWLPGILDGSRIVTAAHTTPVAATIDGHSWRLDGQLLAVPAAPVADAVVATVTLPGGRRRVAIVPLDRPGVRCTPIQATDRQSSAHICFNGVQLHPEDLLGGEDCEVTMFAVRRCQVALAGLQAGVCGHALALTAAYTSQRVQFGRPLSTNQAVAMRAADAYLDTEAIRLTAQRAAWLIDTGQHHPANTAALVAKWWASRAGLRVVHATQHLHGGIGADIDYPVHRYFLWGRQIAFSVGSAAAVAAEIGSLLPDAPPIGAPH